MADRTKEEKASDVSHALVELWDREMNEFYERFTHQLIYTNCLSKEECEALARLYDA
jgi:hypothetical protein